VFGSDDWDFPRSKLASIGWLGRVHRGTPWQTVYLKPDGVAPERWRKEVGSFDTQPTNDWRFLDLFTVAPNDNAARGLMSVNQTNLGAWSALLSGVPVLSNATAGGVALSRFARRDYSTHFIAPSSPQLQAIVRSVVDAQARQPNGVFTKLGGILQARALTVDSPFLGTNINQRQFTISDELYERIPQQVLSLLKPDEPRVVVYVFGQTLKPAPGSIVVAPGPFFQMCTNYQITGEAAVKAVMRFEDAPHAPRAVIESYQLLAPE
jgi:hypothetical protein